MRNPAIRKFGCHGAKLLMRDQKGIQIAKNLHACDNYKNGC